MDYSKIINLVNQQKKIIEEVSNKRSKPSKYL